MAIIHPYFLNYLCSVLRNPSPSTINLEKDPLFSLAQYCCINYKDESYKKGSMQNSFTIELINKAKTNYDRDGIVGVFKAYFEGRIINQFIDREIERKVLVLKKGYKSLASTKASIILRGFGLDLSAEQVLSIYASYGLVRSLKDLMALYDFIDINRRVQRLSELVSGSLCSEDVQKVHNRFLAIKAYVLAGKKGKEKAIKESRINRSIFFYFLKSFKKYGLLGIIDKGQEVFRSSKLGMDNEAQIVLDKVQNPERQELFYVKRLEYKGIKIERSLVSKIFSKWKVREFRSVFISNLDRLENISDPAEDTPVITEVKKKVKRYTDLNFIELLKGIRQAGIHIDAPGLLVLWSYIDELGLPQILEEMGLTTTQNGYSWFDCFLVNVGRIFYGIPSYNKTCKHEEPSLSFFSHLVKLPCLDSLINGLGIIRQEQMFNLQGWLLKKVKEIGLVYGKRIIFDFHQIDLDVIFSKLRQFGKGPSPKKKICCNGFRPHIAWDIDTGSLILAEFRKGSARGTSTVKRFVNDFLIEVFKDLFQEVYIDSEYTGKDVWSFILDSTNGMGAELTACLKQNAFVRKYRDQFLLTHNEDSDFWCYWDDKHVYTNKTFGLQWEYSSLHGDKTPKQFNLNCVVKKNIETGKLRCFGTSKKEHSPREILKNYSSRWLIENGIKDLTISYFLDKCPSTEDPHQVNIHFFIVSICKHIYRMIQRDVEDFLQNSDKTIKSLDTMRECLFRQGNAKVTIVNGTIEVRFLNSFSPQITKNLRKFYQLIHERTKEGLDILGGMKLKFVLLSPHGQEHKNAFKSGELSAEKILDG